MSDVVRQLTRALRRSALAARCGVALTHKGETPWVTVTFAGARHTFHARAEPDALARWLHALPEADLPLHGWFVASCAATVTAGDATIELLVLEE